MLEYQCEPPTYRLFPFENTLRKAELEALADGVVLEGQSHRFLLRSRNRISPPKLSRLAFTSSVRRNGTSYKTTITQLEASSLLARYGTSDTVRKESGYLSHGIHRFKGKFYPQLCRALLNMAEVKPGDLVLDPFAGSGTTLLEAWLGRVNAVGFDISPLAQLIASTKINVVVAGPRRLERTVDRFERRLARRCQMFGLAWKRFGSGEPAADSRFSAEELARECGVPAAESEFSRWFPGPVRHKLAVLVKTIRETRDDVARDFLWVVLSDCIRSVSQQEPRDLRIRRRVRPIEDAPLLQLFEERLLLELRKLDHAEPIISSIRETGATAQAELADVRSLGRPTHAVGQRKADAVITSPPYATALPYVDTDRLSFLVLGLVTRRGRSDLERELIGSREISNGERLALEVEMENGGLKSFPTTLAADLRSVLRGNRGSDVGFRRRNVPGLLYRYFRDMRSALTGIARLVRPDGRVYMVLGDGRTRLGDGAWFPISTCDHVAALAGQVGLPCVHRIPITVTTEDLAHSRNSITTNEILVMRRE